MSERSHCKNILRLIVGAAGMVAAVIFSVSHAQAQAACPAGTVTIASLGPVTGETYDPLDVATKDISFFVNVKNTDLAAGCSFYFAACLAAGQASLEPTPAPTLDYDIVRSSSGTSIVNTTTNPCPANGSALTSVAGFVGVNQTSGTGFFIRISAGQFVRAVSRQESDALEIGIYDSGDNTLLDSAPLSITAIATALASELPDTPTTSAGAGGTTYTPNPGVDGGTIDFSGAISATDATLNAASMTLTFQGARTNYQAFVSVSSQSGGMTKQSGATVVGGSFLERIDYTARVTFCGVSAEVTTAGIAGSKKSAQCTINGINQTDLVVEVSTSAGSTPLVAGQYEDTLTVQIGAQL